MVIYKSGKLVVTTKAITYVVSSMTLLILTVWYTINFVPLPRMYIFPLNAYTCPLFNLPKLADDDRDDQQNENSNDRNSYYAIRSHPIQTVSQQRL